jgi:hypothetical protein
VRLAGTPVLNDSVEIHAVGPTETVVDIVEVSELVGMLVYLFVLHRVHE